MDDKSENVRISPYLDGLRSYGIPRPKAPVDLRLDANEGRPPSAELLAGLADLDPQILCRYRRPTDLERDLAQRHGIAPENLLVTNGGDDAIDRLCKAFLPPGREIILPQPGFDMFHVFSRVAGGRAVFVPWGLDSFPVEAVCEAVNENTGVVVLISPNNPTGLPISTADIRRVSQAAPHAAIALDLAYGPFADEDQAKDALDMDNVLVFHTFSKSMGMAGLRVGYVMGSERMIHALRVAGGPYAVSSLSIVLAQTWLQEGEEQRRDYIERVRLERANLRELLTELGCEAPPSQANFVFAKHPRPEFVLDALGGFGIAIRHVLHNKYFPGGLRITCPGNENDYNRLEHALRTALAPRALLFDMDGVLADVSESYREAIRQTALSYGVELSYERIARAKAAENANDDWKVTRDLLREAGIDADLEDVTERFEALYQGTDGSPGLRERERLIPDKALLQRLAARLPLAVVTGRPREDAERFLERFGIQGLFRSVVTREDAPMKPDPAPVRLAMERLEARHTWMIGDAPDDLRAARRAGALPLGLPAPGDRDCEMRLTDAGAARILSTMEELEDYLP